jgi:hypothetical protein
MEKIHPHKDETYFYGFDDYCMTIGSGAKRKPLIWLSKDMLKWLTKNGTTLFNKHYKEGGVKCHK